MPQQQQITKSKYLNRKYDRDFNRNMMGGRWDNFRWYSTEKNNTRGTQLKLITENRTRKVKLYTKHKRESDTKVKLLFDV